MGNLNQFIEGMDITELPKTFQDAIQLSRRLNNRFLWIDSLCIIQDSKEDWLKESVVMGDIYKHALCNIAATAAPDGRTVLWHVIRHIYSPEVAVKDHHLNTLHLSHHKQVASLSEIHFSHSRVEFTSIHILVHVPNPVSMIWLLNYSGSKDCCKPPCFNELGSFRSVL
jgi:hypothetical protein